jgi:PAS domain S-box-containing protein
MDDQTERSLTAHSQELMDHLLEGCQVIGPDWRYLYVNEAVAVHGRTTRDRLLGRTMMEVYPGIDQAPFFAKLRDCMTNRRAYQFENEFTFPDGATGWFELRIEPVPEGAFILSLDITERKRAEARIQHLNAVLRGIRNVNQLITRERNLETLIRKACELLVESRGFYKCCIVARGPAGERVHAVGGDPERTRILRELVASGGMPDCMAEAMSGVDVVTRRQPLTSCPDCPAARGGAAIDRDCIARLIRDEATTYGVMLVSVPPGYSTDSEELGLLEEVCGDLAFALRSLSTEAQLRFAQRMESVGRLAGGVAHDFNNLLTVINSYADLSLELVAGDDPIRDHLEEIRKAGSRAAALTQQLLAFSRRQVFRPEVVRLDRVVSGLEGMLGRLIGEDVVLALFLAPDTGCVRADPGQLEQVLVNLAVNARDAMPGGGRLSIETANVELDPEYTARRPSMEPGPHVMLSVSDTGCGMDAETQARLFEPFFTTKERGKGTGLGLSTVYGIVKQSGGDIWVYSEPGKGTTFKVYLRREPEDTEKPAQAPAQASSRSGNETILVVEDEDAVRELARRALSAAGYRVQVARDADEAIELCRGGRLSVDLLLTDVVMPGMDGRQLAERLARDLPEMAVLYTSGYTDNAIVHHGVLDPDTSFIPKPFSIADLTRRVREVLDSR